MEGNMPTATPASAAAPRHALSVARRRTILVCAISALICSHTGLFAPPPMQNTRSTGMRAATSERGLLVIDGEASGVAGHAARMEGVNALYIALDDINAMRNHTFDRISPTMGKVRLYVTQIEAGTAHNVIPDKCRFVADIRPTEMYDNAEILSELQGICKSRLKARNLANRSSATRPDSPLLHCISALEIPVFSSPTTSDWMRLGCDAVKMGPGDSSRSHKKDEYITRREIEAGINGYIAFLENFFDLDRLVG